jgi:hypothetical protein
MPCKSKVIFKRHVLRAGLALLAIHLPIFACSSPEPDVPQDMVRAPSVRDITPFSFENKTDPVSNALMDVYGNYIASPGNTQDIALLRQYKERGLNMLREHAQEAAQQLTNDLQSQDPANESRQRILLHLLGSFESELGIQTLFDYALRALPEDSQPTDPDLAEHRPAVVASRLKQSAVAALGRLATAGSATAKQRLLDLVKDAPLEVKTAAIRAFYQSNPPRWKAKRIMASLLGPEDQFLVHAIY